MPANGDDSNARFERSLEALAPTDRMDKLAEAQAEATGKLNAAIELMDRHLREQGK